ncbi:alpha/beta-Hydrolase [Glarea lozoyensis ATCC 20868]|uniref:Alpha/beta-Hydrolase n=1 Tax=Glarea lozoyensis (strain ATCC 20868 / MF5171) TaxID=1116229 RepID=S3DUD3_GLAL2|nr:alpha/beta-Hydrolase [Glarea lozoyensis ATCC 20868]EPE30038.1 alpha/beta-Hydrolase [Glarea lozoyensis ATCC 20868]
MPLKSDVVIEAAKFDPANNSEQANKLNQYLLSVGDKGPAWYEVGAPKYREMRWKGESAFPAPTVIAAGVNFTIPSREPGRNIPCRVLYPSKRTTDTDRKQCRGSVMHIHGGGWVLGDERSSDPLCQFYADTGDLAVVTVGYRHAPEDPFPKGPEDCFDAGEYLVKNSEKDYGGPLRFIGGESAGGHLSLLVVFHLLKAFSKLDLCGLILNFGCYDLTETPSHVNTGNTPIIPPKTLEHFRNAFLPNMSLLERRSPSVSPYYENLAPFRGRLPSALFTCGTEDPLLDDSVMMGTRWLMAGGEAYIKIYTGGPHGFVAFGEALKEAQMAMGDIATYIEQCMEKLDS